MEAITLPQGQIVLPVEIRRRLGLEAGMRLEVEFDKKTGCILLWPINPSYPSSRPVREKVKLVRKLKDKKRLR